MAQKYLTLAICTSKLESHQKKAVKSTNTTVLILVRSFSIPSMFLPCAWRHPWTLRMAEWPKDIYVRERYGWSIDFWFIPIWSSFKFIYDACASVGETRACTGKSFRLTILTFSECFHSYFRHICTATSKYHIKKNKRIRKRKNKRNSNGNSSPGPWLFWRRQVATEDVYQFCGADAVRMRPFLARNY